MYRARAAGQQGSGEGGGRSARRESGKKKGTWGTHRRAGAVLLGDLLQLLVVFFCGFGMGWDARRSAAEGQGQRQGQGRTNVFIFSARRSAHTRRCIA